MVSQLVFWKLLWPLSGFGTWWPGFTCLIFFFFSITSNSIICPQVHKSQMSSAQFHSFPNFLVCSALKISFANRLISRQFSERVLPRRELRLGTILFCLSGLVRLLGLFGHLLSRVKASSLLRFDWHRHRHGHWHRIIVELRVLRLLWWLRILLLLRLELILWSRHKRRSGLSH